jgi:hypothetical protein
MVCVPPALQFTIVASMQAELTSRAGALALLGWFTTQLPLAATVV